MKIYSHVTRLSPQEVQALPAIINTREACGILGIQPNTLQRLVRQGKFPASKTGSRLLFSKATVCKLAGIDIEEKGGLAMPNEDLHTDVDRMCAGSQPAQNGLEERLDMLVAQMAVIASELHELNERLQFQWMH